ncbi:hypothetical protein Tco_1325680, partial [Tanacetum coccineum]
MDKIGPFDVGARNARMQHLKSVDDASRNQHRMPVRVLRNPNLSNTVRSAEQEGNHVLFGANDGNKGTNSDHVGSFVGNSGNVGSGGLGATKVSSLDKETSTNEYVSAGSNHANNDGSNPFNTNVFNVNCSSGVFTSSSGVFTTSSQST